MIRTQAYQCRRKDIDETIQRDRYSNTVIRLSKRYRYRGFRLEIQDTDDRLDALGCKHKSKYHSIPIRL